MTRIDTRVLLTTCISYPSFPVSGRVGPGTYQDIGPELEYYGETLDRGSRPAAVSGSRRDLTARKCRAASCTAQAVWFVFSCWGSGVGECQ